MPTYDYVCNKCGPFEAFSSIAARDAVVGCPFCASPSLRLLLNAPRLAIMKGGRRHAMAVNEKASHEPVNSKAYTSKPHPFGCGCCASATVKSASGSTGETRSFPDKRPWMISH
ncbi:FmdB family transcriptional regulator [Pollutimonas subterranea]|uniref:FmdB family transcriptional regulator n=1 Tax=Pollutimonas subterranea TaxID=2045210 RepID=A0A2N4U2X9_9BURK|nr:zinc ribbon domain-containing protein [Pollutimonas subterranea]PLC49366.1 FmdB family transcriptional regulator [Pollutimonas subterranea]